MMNVIGRGKCHSRWIAELCASSSRILVFSFAVRTPPCHVLPAFGPCNATPCKRAASQPARAQHRPRRWGLSTSALPKKEPAPLSARLWPFLSPQPSFFKPSQSYPQLPSSPSQLRPQRRPRFSPRPLRLHLPLRRPSFIPPTLLANLISDICSFQRRCGVGVRFECWIGGALAAR
jgi:hypothetical protein